MLKRLAYKHMGMAIVAPNCKSVELEETILFYSMCLGDKKRNNIGHTLILHQQQGGKRILVSSSCATQSTRSQRHEYDKQSCACNRGET